MSEVETVEEIKIKQEIQNQSIAWGSPVVLIFTNGMSVVSYVAFYEDSKTMLVKDAYTITRNFQGDMIILKFLPETANEFHTIGTDKLLTVGAVCPQVLETYQNVLYGKKPDETIH